MKMMGSESTIACLVWDFVEKEHVLLSEYLIREQQRKNKGDEDEREKLLELYKKHNSSKNV